MLNNTIYKLKNNKKLNIGYFGGSITEGAGASDPSKCWRSITTQWFRDTYPDCEINEIMAAIGGTGSDLGAYRCEKDLLSGDPDLVFLEFSCNDAEDPFLPIVNNVESIYRKIWTKNPAAEIIVIYTMIKSMDEDMAAGKVIESRAAHMAAALYYGNIMQIDMGEILRRKVHLSGGDWNTYTVDTVHPNDEGYRIYADAVISRLNEALSGDVTEIINRALPKSLFGERSYVGAHLVDAKKAEFSEGWRFVESSLCERYPHYYEALTPGAALEYNFTGIRIGLYWMMAKDSGDIEYSIDGGEWKSVSSWDFYCKNFDRAHRMMLSGDLERGVHMLKLRVSANKEEESEGYAIRIGAFLVCD